MDAKLAIATAKKLFSDLFSDEAITEVGLEEVDFVETNETWKITLGFSRPKFPLNRWYKVIALRDSDGSMIYIRNRETASV